MNELLQRAARGECLADLDIIDAHGHVGIYSFAYPDASPASMVAAMDRIGVRSILCSHARTMSADVSRGNDVLFSIMRGFPGRILGYVALWPASAAECRKETIRRLEQGFVGVKLHSANGFAYTDEAYAPALAIADERRLPVLLHTWGEEQTFDAARTLADRYPGASFLLAHTGCCNEEGYLRTARAHGNVYLELALSMSPRGLVDRLVEAVGPEKVIWGSDCSFLCMTQQLGKVVGSHISDHDKRLILSGNMRRILDAAVPAEVD